MRKTAFLFFSFMLLAGISNAGQIDTNYVQKFKSLFSVKGFLLNNGFQYTITPQNNDNFSHKELNNARIFYSASIPPVTGVSLNIKGVGLTYIFKFTDDYLDTTSRIRSGFKQFGINMYGNKFGFEAFYQDYSRFYFHYKGDEILLKNYNADIRAYQFGGSLIFINNGKKFSYNAAFNQNVFQKKSIGSSLTVFALKYSEITSDHLIPDSVKKYFSEYPDLRSNRNYAFIFQQGYAYNLVKNSWYFSNALFVGVGLQNQVYEASTFKKNKIGVPLSARAKSSAGYNGKIFFGGIYANADIAQSKIKPLETLSFQYTYGLYIGLRAITLTKTKGQLKAEARRKKEAEKNAKKKAADAKKQAAIDAKEAKKKKKK
jgi:hypothetical protein